MVTIENLIKDGGNHNIIVPFDFKILLELFLHEEKVEELIRYILNGLRYNRVDGVSENSLYVKNKDENIYSLHISLRETKSKITYIIDLYKGNENLFKTDLKDNNKMVENAVKYVLKATLDLLFTNIRHDNLYK